MYKHVNVKIVINKLIKYKIIRFVLIKINIVYNVISLIFKYVLNVLMVMKYNLINVLKN